MPIKCSICVTLLRIATARRPYELFLYGLVGLVVISAIIFNVAVGNLCKPIEALWGEKQGICNPSLNSSVSFFFSAVAIVTDWSLAIVPGFLLWNVQMKGRVKISVALILGLAALCVAPAPPPSLLYWRNEMTDYVTVRAAPPSFASAI